MKKIKLSFLVVLTLLSCQSKVELSQGVQEYLIATKELQQKYETVQVNFFAPPRDSIAEKNYKMHSDQLSVIVDELMLLNEQFSTTGLTQAEKLIAAHNKNYVGNLCMAITQLRYILLKLDGPRTIPRAEYEGDIERLYLFRDSYIEQGKLINKLLKQFAAPPASPE